MHYSSQNGWKHISLGCVYIMHICLQTPCKESRHIQKNPYFEAQILKRSQNKMTPMHIRTRVRIRTEIVPYSRALYDGATIRILVQMYKCTAVVSSCPEHDNNIIVVFEYCGRYAYCMHT